MTSLSKFLSVTVVGLSAFAAATAEQTTPSKAGPGGPVELFVSSSLGDDANQGTSAAEPLKTVSAAIQRAKPPCTLTLLPGWYEGGIVLRPGTERHPMILQASRRGRVFIGRPRVLRGLGPAEGLVYTHVAPSDQAPAILIESDTLTILRQMATSIDVEELAGTYCFDEKEGKVYVHPTDSAGVAHHTYRAVAPGVGVRLANHSVIRGLVVTGFGEAAISGRNLTGSEVRDCILYGNGYGIALSGGSDCLIRGNEVWSNQPGYDAGAQIFIGASPKVERIRIERNLVYDGPKIGVRFYGTLANDCVLRENLILGNGAGFSCKVAQGKGNTAEGNVCFNKGGDLSAPIMRRNTYGQAIYRDPDRHRSDGTDLETGGLKADPKFADPAHRDYRLQGDSLMRGGAPDGSDLGAHPYEGSVVFVRPDGGDSKDGTSVAGAWKTLGRAARSLRPGQTLYIAPGHWGQPLVLTNIKALPSKPTLIRVHGRREATLPQIRVDGCSNLRIEGLRVAAAGGAGIEVVSSEAIGLARCAAYGGKSSGVSVAGSKGVSLDHCALYANAGPGLEARESCSDVALTSSIIGKNAGPQIRLGARVEQWYSEFNAFEHSVGAGALGQTKGQRAGNLGSWRKLSSSDATSTELDSLPLVAPEDGDFRVRSGSALAHAGRYARAVGPDGLAAAERIVRQPFERVEVISTSRTTANIAYWTPGRVCGTLIEWGETTQYGNRHDRASWEYGEYETCHTVSLLGLEPDKTYHFRLGRRDFPVQVEGEALAHAQEAWSKDYTFTTAREDPEPRQFHVSLSGDDWHDGLSPQNAWRTLHKAARRARAGDTVTIAPGRYMELLRPLQTGTSDDRRITFRAARPLSVFLDGGHIRSKREGRSHCIQVQSKAYVTFENLACEKVKHHDNGGYRGGLGYSGLIGISGSAGIEVRNCVMDGRHRYMSCLWVFEAGKMPGVPDSVVPLTVTDSLLLHGWRCMGLHLTRPCVFRNNAFVRGQTGMITILRSPPGGVILRNNILQSLIKMKRGLPIFRYGKPEHYDSDYNCFAWDPENPNRRIMSESGPGGLAPWQEKCAKDGHGIEAEPGYPLSAMMGFGTDGQPGKTHSGLHGLSQAPLRVKDLILPRNSPCRGKGEDGEDIGPRWQRFADADE